MKLSRLYSNKQAILNPIEFVPGLNAIIGEIRVPENRNRDTHNLGKTKLARLLDFVLLDNRDPNFFLFKRYDVFSEFVFYLEIQLEDGSHLTIRRGVSNASKISLKRHDLAFQNFTATARADWDHYEIAFERAKTIVDGLLKWEVLKPWDFRKLMGYLLRTQDDYSQVFQLEKFSSKHLDWKPFLGHILGFDGNLLQRHYNKEEELKQKDDEASIIRRELGGSIEEIGGLEGLIVLKTDELQKKERLLEAFDFRAQDKAQTKELVDSLDVNIAELNSERYSLNQTKQRILHSLEGDQILFDPDKAAELFEEAGIFFHGQLKKDFEQLIAFNRAITDERSGYLRAELEEISSRISELNAELNEAGKKRSEALGYLTATDAFEKYKQISDSLVSLKADIEVLRRRRDSVTRLQDLAKDLRRLESERLDLQLEVEANVREQDTSDTGLFRRIRLIFNEIVTEVIDQHALLSVFCNSLGHLEFRAEILDKEGKATSADDGHTYRKLLCIAFDLAVLRAHLSDNFPRFVYHDGVFEALEPRKKQNLLRVLKEYANLGLQPIITLLDFDSPPFRQEGDAVIADDEIILRLHDGGDDGLLFKMAPW